MLEINNMAHKIVNNHYVYMYVNYLYYEMSMS